MDNKRLFLATLLSVLIVFAFEYLMPRPNTQQTVNKPEQTSQRIQEKPTSDLGQVGHIPQVKQESGPEMRIPIDADAVKGSINLRGAILDDLVLKNFRETVKPDSPLVRVLEPIKNAHPNFVEGGWLNTGDGSVKTPDQNSIWKANGDKITPDHPITLTWDNGQGLVFEKVISIDKNFMFTMEQRVKNNSTQSVSLYFYGRVSRAYTPVEMHGYLVHEGPIGVIDQRLEQNSYKTLRQDAKGQDHVAWSKASKGGWAGITDKYWLTAIIPQQDKDITVTYGFEADANQPVGTKPGEEKGIYQVGFSSQKPISIGPGETVGTVANIFSGAKEVHLLERYEKSYHIPDFWKAVDFGWFAILTHPIFYILDSLNTFWGNFGLALMSFTLIVKAIFYPLASKQFHSMGKMKALQPKMQAVRERYKDDQMAMNQQIMALYKKEGVNPASGCLPMLIQIPIFWCLYKVLYVTIEMRHAPFFGWIQDLSAPDPTNLLNLFGLIPWDPTIISPMLQLGIWPLIFGLTMYLQQRLNPTPLDPMQQRMFQLMPIIFTVVLAGQPAGLVIYYSWNNLLTAIQQSIIQKHAAIKEKAKLKKEGKG